MTASQKKLAKKLKPFEWLTTIRSLSRRVRSRHRHKTATSHPAPSPPPAPIDNPSSTSDLSSEAPSRFKPPSTPAHPFPFQCLPAELRHQIIAHVLTTPLATPQLHHATDDWLDRDEKHHASVKYPIAEGVCNYDNPVLYLNRRLGDQCPYLPLLLTSRAVKEDVEAVAGHAAAKVQPVLDVKVVTCEKLRASWLRIPVLVDGGVGKGKGRVEEVVIDCLTIAVRFCSSSTMTYKIDLIELILRNLIRRVTGEGPSPYTRVLNGGKARVKHLVIELQTTANAARFKNVNRKVPLARCLHLAWLEDDKRQEKELGNVDAIDIRVDGVDLYKIRGEAQG